MAKVFHEKNSYPVLQATHVHSQRWSVGAMYVIPGPHQVPWVSILNALTMPIHHFFILYYRRESKGAVVGILPSVFHVCYNGNT